jgi:hypothetical protein
VTARNFARAAMDESHPRNGGPAWVRHRCEAEHILCDAGAAILHLPGFYGPQVHAHDQMCGSGRKPWLPSQTIKVIARSKHGIAAEPVHLRAFFPYDIVAIPRFGFSVDCYLRRHLISRATPRKSV